MTAETKQKALERKKVLVEEMERVIDENRELIVERTAARLRKLGVKVK